MKNFLCVLLAVIFVFVLCSCNVSTPTTEFPPETSNGGDIYDSGSINGDTTNSNDENKETVDNNKTEGNVSDSGNNQTNTGGSGGSGTSGSSGGSSGGGGSSSGSSGGSSGGGSSNDNSQEDNNQVQKEPLLIKVEINNVEFEATLIDIEATRQLIAKIPFTLSMKDLNANEKYYFFNETFKTQSINVRNIESGDLMLYGNNCLVLFYKSFNTSYSYTKLGKLNDVEKLQALINNANDITIKFYLP